MKKITLMFGLLFAAQFSNAQDTCASAVPISAAGEWVVTAVNGTQVPSPICADNGAGATAGEWYKYTPTQDYTVVVTANLPINNGKDTRVHVYTGSCAALNCYAGDDDSGAGYLSVCTFNVVGGNTYYIAWDNRWSSAGFTFQLTEGDVVVPPPTPVSYSSTNIATVNSNYNMCIVDMNGDHVDDIVGVSNNNMRVHFQQSGGTFNISDFAITGPSYMPGWSLAAGDLNKDGYNDLLLGSGNGLTFWQSNNTGSAYTAITPGQYIFCQRTNFQDVDNDGNLDAFSCHDVDPNVYYLNDGAGNYTYYQSGISEGAYNLGIIMSGGNYASIWSDFDNDGDSDMFISKCSGPPCELHRNDGAAGYTDVSALAAINVTPVQSWSSAVNDFDNDGDMDILVGSNGSTGNFLYRNNLDDSHTITAFTNVTAGSGFEENVPNRDWISYDFDNNGFIDILGGGNRIMFNQGNMVFTPVSYPSIGIGAVGDLNNDGFLDIMQNNTVRYAVPNGNNWFKVALQGVASNSNGIGARIEIYGAWGKQIRDIRSGEGFGYMSTLNAHFGLGAATEIEKVIVRWPSGAVDVVMNPTPNAMMSLVEGSSPLAVGENNLSAFTIYPNPTSGTIHISQNNGVEAKHARVIDMLGRLVLSTAVLDNQVSVEKLAKGNYVILLEDANGKTFTQKFIKE
jgi:hypothetical protein